MNCRKLVLTIIFLLCGGIAFSQSDNNSLVSALNQITNDTRKRTELLVFVKNLLEHDGISFYEELPYEYHGVDYAYAVNGKYLFVFEKSYGGAGSSYEDTKSYIIDTELKRLIQTRNLFTDLANSSFQRLIIEYLSQQENFDMVDQSDLRKSIIGTVFSLFYVRNAVGFQWDKGSVSAKTFGAYRIIIPYSKLQNYLTPIGKEVFK